MTEEKPGSNKSCCCANGDEDACATDRAVVAFVREKFLFREKLPQQAILHFAGAAFSVAPDAGTLTWWQLMPGIGSALVLFCDAG